MVDDLMYDKYEAAYGEFFAFITDHPHCTRTELIHALGWSPLKVDAFLRWGINTGILESTETAGETTYVALDFKEWYIKIRKREIMEERVARNQQLFETPLPPESPREKFDLLTFLMENNLL